MKKFPFLMLCGALALGACTDDDGSTSIRKGAVNEDTLASGMDVSVNGSLGTIVVPFAVAVPSVPTADLQDELDGAVSLAVVSAQSGATADLTSGTMVDGEPTAAGEFSWALNDARSEVTLTFYNQTSGGLSLTPGNGYTAQFSVSTNDFVQRVPAVSFDVRVSGN